MLEAILKVNYNNFPALILNFFLFNTPGILLLYSMRGYGIERIIGVIVSSNNNNDCKLFNFFSTKVTNTQE
jgi:hypothetical protein